MTTETQTIYPPETWLWFGHAAHFICGKECQYHLATHVGPWLVSTIGEYWPSRASRDIIAEIDDPTWFAKHWELKGDHFDAEYMRRFGFHEIGFGRKYETMVFVAGEPCKVDGCGCGLPIPSDYTELEMDGYNSPGDATRGHYRLCSKYAAIKEVEHASD